MPVYRPSPTPLPATAFETKTAQVCKNLTNAIWTGVNFFNRRKKRCEKI